MIKDLTITEAHHYLFMLVVEDKKVAYKELGKPTVITEHCTDENLEKLLDQHKLDMLTVVVELVRDLRDGMVCRHSSNVCCELCESKPLAVKGLAHWIGGGNHP